VQPGYIGKQLLPVLVANGHNVTGCLRDPSEQIPRQIRSRVRIIRFNLNDGSTFSNVPADIDGAFYLVQPSPGINKDQEKIAAINFRNVINKTNVKHVVYFNTYGKIKTVEDELADGNYNLSVIRPGIIIGEGSVYFEIIREMVERQPFIIVPGCLKAVCRPAGISDILTVLASTLFNKQTYNKTFYAGGPDMLSFVEVLKEYAEARNLKRKIHIISGMGTKVYSFWLNIITPASSPAVSGFINCLMETDVSDTEIYGILRIKPAKYRESLAKVFGNPGNLSDEMNPEFHFSESINVPVFGCYTNEKTILIFDHRKTIEKIWDISSNNGWYYVRLSSLVKTSLSGIFTGNKGKSYKIPGNDLKAGDNLDFWKVIYADKAEGRLLLFSDLKLPGEAWLEFEIRDNRLVQTATFRPKGLRGRLYWLFMRPFHELVFRGMIMSITDHRKPVTVHY
jgi:uncharacterized protein YbjT (DUF2867 family)